ncbi:hypothetical protein HN371_29770 [Candidatus Poribacteria bacterium]|jgi:hypothetical protein|nr:hypothetical protein [Candidatus Poribacteria bacterium]MBT5531813.1 hypothetical protein [Candidatus Poribacteria bacterium]MBT5713237.1 hypothetical protein [Candidatus Poribacteria bacterium]MBT7097367.1 hypothetical protein [Candidatus Poribacteria bacterium]MBT7807418.1 hypothetical protein [Candidatus Poribacteria bacterium]
MRRLFLTVLGTAALTSAACAASDGIGQMGVFYANVGWIGGAAASTAGDEIVANQNAFEDAQVYDLDGTEEWVIANTGDGDIDCLVMFGYTPETIYEPGNGDADDSPLEAFIDDGNFVMNSADYIFYVTAGGGTNGENGVKTVMDASFDLWTDGNLAEPTADGAKYTPSLDAFTSNRSFKLPQVDADPAWDAEAIFGEGPAGADPVVLHNNETGGRVGIWMQVSNDALNRGEVAVEIFNNWVPTVISTSVEPAGKATTTWGELKGF